MSSVDKNEAMINFIKTCPAIKDSPLYFNFAEEKDGANHITTETDRAVKKPFIDGSVMRHYTFSIISYKSVSHNPLVDQEGFTDENVENMAQVQTIIDWINEQEYNHNYPDFGSTAVVDKMSCMTEDPNIRSVDLNKNPPLAKYSIMIRIEYLDTSKVIFQ